MKKKSITTTRKKMIIHREEAKSSFRISSMLMIVVIITVALILVWKTIVSVKEWYDSMDPILPEVHRRLLKVHDQAKHIKVYRGNKSYTLNKKKVYLCLYNEKNEYYHINMLMYVAIHELAHCICDEIGHTPKFFKIFHELLEIAEAEGVYDATIPPIDDYCAHDCDSNTGCSLDTRGKGPSGPWSIQFRNVSFGYPSDTNPLFSSLNSKIPAGSRWILYGPKAKGKSTFLQLLMRFHSPLKGNIMINDSVSLEDIDVRTLHQHIAYMNDFTNVTLTGRTIEDNIRYENDNLDTSRILTSLKKYNLLHFLSSGEKESEILQRACGVHGNKLTTEQQKVILFVRTLLTVNHNTRLLLLDRPFENIPPATQQSLVQWISDIVNTYPTLSTIVTSRNNLEDPQRLQPIGFQALSMDNLT